MNKLILLLSLAFTACTSDPIIFENKDVIVSRVEAPKNCDSLGAIEGRSSKLNAPMAEVIEDLKSEAVKKGANFVKLETMGAMATSVRGSAYFCK